MVNEIFIRVASMAQFPNRAFFDAITDKSEHFPLNYDIYIPMYVPYKYTFII